MQIIVVLALAAMVWLIWQLIKAKRFTRFKQKIEDELKEKVIARCQYKSRILHAALQREIITEQWLRDSGNLRNAQHLFFVERQYLPTTLIS